jgi:hypothetical protein
MKDVSYELRLEIINAFSCRQVTADGNYGIKIRLSNEDA